MVNRRGASDSATDSPVLSNPAGIKSTEESVSLSDAPSPTDVINKNLNFRGFLTVILTFYEIFGGF